MKKLVSLFFLLYVFLVAMGQGADTVNNTPSRSLEDTPSMADAFRSNGKIYVVVAVVVTILLGLFLYLFRLDRRISRLEKGKL